MILNKSILKTSCWKLPDKRTMIKRHSLNYIDFNVKRKEICFDGIELWNEAENTFWIYNFFTEQELEQDSKLQKEYEKVIEEQYQIRSSIGIEIQDFDPKQTSKEENQKIIDLFYKNVADNNLILSKNKITRPSVEVKFNREQISEDSQNYLNQLRKIRESILVEFDPSKLIRYCTYARNEEAILMRKKLEENFKKYLDEYKDNVVLKFEILE